MSNAFGSDNQVITEILPAGIEAGKEYDAKHERVVPWSREGVLALIAKKGIGAVDPDDCVFPVGDLANGEPVTMPCDRCHNEESLLKMGFKELEQILPLFIGEEKHLCQACSLPLIADPAYEILSLYHQMEPDPQLRRISLDIMNMAATGLTPEQSGLLRQFYPAVWTLLTEVNHG